MQPSPFINGELKNISPGDFNPSFFINGYSYEVIQFKKSSRIRSGVMRPAKTGNDNL